MHTVSSAVVERLPIPLYSYSNDLSCAVLDALNCVQQFAYLRCSWFQPLLLSTIPKILMRYLSVCNEAVELFHQELIALAPKWVLT